MLGFNWVDLIILGLIVAGIFYGLRAGMAIMLFVLGGFFGALFLGGFIFPKILPISDQALLTIVNGNLVLLFAIFVAIKGYDYGQRFRYSLGEGTVYKIQNKLGVAVSTLAVLVIVWLVGAMIGRLPFEGLSNSVRDSWVVSRLDSTLPPIPAVFALFDKQINPNAEPYVKMTTQPIIGQLPAGVDMSKAIEKANESTVRITSFGCGGLVSGSGFVVDPGYVATNAHVVAGVKRPIIKHENRSYEGQVVLFDANTDFAVIRVDNLPAKPIGLSKEVVENNTPVIMSGFPGGNQTLSLGVIRNRTLLYGSNIYRNTEIARQVYEVQADVEDGSSGGPIILQNGQVAGILFARSQSNQSYGFVLASNTLIKELEQATKNRKAVNTGVCVKQYVPY